MFIKYIFYRLSAILYKYTQTHLAISNIQNDNEKTVARIDPKVNS